MSDFRILVENFYKAPEDDRASHRSVFSSTVDRNNDSGDAPSRKKPFVDERMLEKVWGWLIQRPDIRVQEDTEAERSKSTPSEGNKLVGAAGEILAEDEDADVGTASDAAPARNELDNFWHGSVIRVTEDRMWRALAGHGVDLKRVRESEFTLLSLIGAAGPNGIRQPDLTALSGQDKRSLPHRTDELHRKGYIEKKSLKLKGHPTSLCTLRRWVKTAPAPQASGNAVVELPPPDILRTQLFSDGVIHGNRFLEVTMQLLKEANGFMTWDDFRKRLVGIVCYSSNGQSADACTGHRRLQVGEASGSYLPQAG